MCALQSQGNRLNERTYVGNPGVIWRSPRDHHAAQDASVLVGPHQRLSVEHFLVPMLCYCHVDELEEKHILAYDSVLPFSEDTTSLGEEGGYKTVLLFFNLFKNRRLSGEVNEVCFSLDRDPSSHSDPPSDGCKIAQPKERGEDKCVK